MPPVYTKMWMAVYGSMSQINKHAYEQMKAFLCCPDLGSQQGRNVMKCYVTKMLSIYNTCYRFSIIIFYISLFNCVTVAAVNYTVTITEYRNQTTIRTWQGSVMLPLNLKENKKKPMNNINSRWRYKYLYLLCAH